jgi:hypothetical protein
MTKKGPNVTKTDSRPSLSGALQHKEVANPLCLNSQGRPAWCSLMTPLWILGPFLGALITPLWILGPFSGALMNGEGLTPAFLPTHRAGCLSDESEGLHIASYAS